MFDDKIHAGVTGFTFDQTRLHCLVIGEDYQAFTEQELRKQGYADGHCQPFQLKDYGFLVFGFDLVH